MEVKGQSHSPSEHWPLAFTVSMERTVHHNRAQKKRTRKRRGTEDGGEYKEGEQEGTGPMGKDPGGTASPLGNMVSSNSRKIRKIQGNSNGDIQDSAISMSELYGVFDFHLPACKANPGIKDCLNPNCLHGLGFRKEGLWSKSPPHNALLGPSPLEQKRSPDLFVGLKNLGATCYMNVFIQALFLNDKFRTILYQFVEDKSCTEEAKRYAPVVKRLAEVFANLQLSLKTWYNPTAFAKLLGIQVKLSMI